VHRTGGNRCVAFPTHFDLLRYLRIVYVHLGVGSRIGGHLRLGGEQMRKRHRRYQTVGMVNEYRSSQTCAICFNAMVLSGKRKSVNGSSVCYNHLCPTYALGNKTKNRDVEAANCIAIGAMTILLHGAALSPFAFRHNKPSQSRWWKACDLGPRSRCILQGREMHIFLPTHHKMAS
jgi:hypothetical protein